MTEQTFVAVATFKDGTDMDEVGRLVPDEVAKVEELRAAGRLGSVHIALARGTVFIEVVAGDEDAAVATIRELPLGKFFDLDLFETIPPGLPTSN